MLTKEENEILTRVGPGTPAGELLRRYWHPICAAEELRERPKKIVRVLGEDLVLFRLPDGRLGLIQQQCAHRGASLYYGFLEKDGLRCAYHGWKYDIDGKCLEQPFEPGDSYFKDRIKQPAYKVRQYRSLIWAYLGPEPAPLIPDWEILSRSDGVRLVIIFDSNYNWLQGMENSMDTTHTYFLHGVMLKQTMPESWMKVYKDIINYYNRPIEKYEFAPYELGFLRRRTYGGGIPNKEGGYPVIFPNITVTPQLLYEITWRVPIDDTHTRAVHMEFLPSLDHKEMNQPDEMIPVRINPHVIRGQNGEYLMNNFPSTDVMAMETSGPIFDRATEHLGASDRGVILYRKLLREQIEAIKGGRDPIGIIRDENKNKTLKLIDQNDYERKIKWAVENGLLTRWSEEILNGRMPKIDDDSEHMGHGI